MRQSLAQLEERFSAKPDAVLGHLSEAFRMPTLRLDEMRACSPAFDLIPYAEAVRRSCAALRSPEGDVLAALADPYDGATQDWLEEHLRLPFSYRVAHQKELAAYLAQQEEGLRAMDGLGLQADAASALTEGSDEISIEAISEIDSAVVKLVTSTLYDALKSSASDIHLEKASSGLVIKYRVDGVLATIKTVEGTDFADQVLSRVKVMSELDIAERRVPQDGRFRARSKGREIDFRVSVMPSVFGEDAVLRILDKRSLCPRRPCTLCESGAEQ